METRFRKGLDSEQRLYCKCLFLQGIDVFR